MNNNKMIAPDVDLAELASLTKNYSGAEIAGNKQFQWYFMI